MGFGTTRGQLADRRAALAGLVRERFFTPRLRFKSYDELNAWLLDKCLGWAKAHANPERPGWTIWEVFEEERPKLIPYRGRFDGFHALPASVSKTCLVRFDNSGQADFLHPALGQDLTPSSTARRAQAGPDVRARSARRGARVDSSRPCVA